MRVVTAEQIKKLDENAIKGLGIPGIVLMENAALSVVDEITRDLGGVHNRNIVVFAGKGNNGGDAFAAARHLHIMGANVLVIIAGKSTDISGDALVNLNILRNMKVKMVEVTDKADIDMTASGLYISDAIIDGIFGTGLERNVEGLTFDIIETINKSGRYVVSIDVPSGLDGSTGRIMGTCVRASKTVTFTFPKLGMVVAPGVFFCGNVVVRDIGIPPAAGLFEGPVIHLIEKSMVSGAADKRMPDTNKGDYGKVLVIAGSQGMTGAAALCASAAMRTGAGLVYPAVPKSLLAILEQKVTGPVFVPFEDRDKGTICKKGIGPVLEKMAEVDAAAVGPGLSTEKEAAEAVREILLECRVPVVIDADALNIISEDLHILKKVNTAAVVTPHPGEMAKLMGTSVREVQHNRIDMAREFSKRWEVITVLKGYRTVISDPEGNVYVNPTGNAGMATAGSGDVLTGMIAALLGRGYKPVDAAVSGVYLHGLAGDLAAAEKGEHGMIAGDVVEKIPDAIKSVDNE